MIIKDMAGKDFQLTSEGVCEQWAIGKSGGHGYRVCLSDLRRINANVSKRGTVDGYCDRCGKGNSVTTFDVRVGKKSVLIGCTRFNGEAAKAILKAIGR